MELAPSGEYPTEMQIEPVVRYDTETALNLARRMKEQADMTGRVVVASLKDSGVIVAEPGTAPVLH